MRLGDNRSATSLPGNVLMDSDHESAVALGPRELAQSGRNRLPEQHDAMYDDGMSPDALD
jgi:hypothetical protein